MRINYLTAKDIEQIHDKIIKVSGGEKGTKSPADLEFIISQSKVPTDLERVAATLLFGVLATHPFADGNKRTALIVTESFLLKNGKKLTASHDEILEIIERIVLGGLNFEDTVLWLQKNTGNNGIPCTADKLVKEHLQLLKKLTRVHYKR